MAKSILEMSAEIIAAQAKHKAMGPDEMADSLRMVFQTLQEIHQLGQDGEGDEETASGDSLAYLRRNPLKSIQRNQIICLESGKAYKLLSNRHLALYSLTPRSTKKSGVFR